MQHRSKLALLTLGLTLCSCVTTNVTPLSGSVRPATRPEDVRVYLQEQDIKGKYEKVALIHAQGDSRSTDQKQMLSEARKEAAKLGANGLILSEVDEASREVEFAATRLGGTTQRHGELVAVYVYPVQYESTGPSSAQDGNPGGEAARDEGPSFEEWLSQQPSPKDQDD